MREHSHDPEAFAKWQAGQNQKQKWGSSTGAERGILMLVAGVFILLVMGIVGYSLAPDEDSPAYEMGHKAGWIVGKADALSGAPRDGERAAKLGRYHADGDTNYQSGYHQGYNDGYHAAKR